MSIIRSSFENIKGHRTEISRKTYKKEDRHFHREAKSQKAQLLSKHQHGTRKDVKIKINRKLT
ncbi:hypothetical protein SAMN02745883_01719 [Caminicella sporogenes DSM 14501]|uniref:Uncharacterized protein n=1 Tax=Caminicella sporogenes DSM 14501 TaxID=1121266 RepID=A0A1M6R783_9FIRM|nr:hypothetical protein [Caminicella sporogenes]RKD27327.1 hypothetical protein BET04_09335 [Caminicella sporogenes]WIF94237.1 hypothetical protein QNI18_07960 [Caminicella sporogenes]SHK28303.1 hypothetical protein SAMN02745883_01719 [Caminicella sporogenes DSM 14501]